jgi:hypothetical protein
MQRHRTSIGLVALLFAVSACTARPAAEPSPEPTASPTPRPTASPTPEPVDIAEAFSAAMQARLSMEAVLTGQLQIGALTGEFSGELRASGGDSHVRSVLSFPGQPPHESETITVGQAVYEKTATGIWMLRSGAHAGEPEDDELSAALSQGSRSLVEDGTEIHGTMTLHRLVATDGQQLSATALGLPEGVSETQAELVFLAEGDGTPAGFAVRAEWSDGPAGPGRVELIYRFTSVNEVVRIEPPAEAWVLHASEDFGYRLAHPSRWDFRRAPATDEYDAHDRFIAPIDGEVQVYWYSEVEPGTVANEWLRGSGFWMEESLGVRPEVIGDFTLAGGAQGRIFAVHTEMDGYDWFIQQASVFAGHGGWDLVWWSDPGDEEAHKELFATLVGTFEPIQD